MVASKKELPRHIAIVMDGNGRWAQLNDRPRVEGHRKGADSVREIVRAARETGIRALTLYAFSAQNWERPLEEVKLLMELLRKFVIEERTEIMENGIRLTTIGDVERLPGYVLEPLEALRADSAGNGGMTLCLALSYGARESIVEAARKIAAGVQAGALEPGDVTAERFAAALSTRELPPLDLLIRTSGEQRLSNFLLWEAAYAELYFTPTLWPDFSRKEFAEALAAYQGRERRFGLTTEQIRLIANHGG